MGTNLNRGSIVLTIESQDIYTHPAESFLVIEGQLLKNDDTVYDNPDHIALINNGMMYLFSDVRFHLASHEIEVLQNPGHATTMLGMLKYPDDFYKSSGLNQLWIKDENEGEAEERIVQPTYNRGFDIRHKYIIRTSNPKGSFEFKIPLKHFLGFCEAFFNPAPAPAGAAPPANPGANTIAYAVIISDRLFHFVSDGSKITNIV